MHYASPKPLSANQFSCGLPMRFSSGLTSATRHFTNNLRENVVSSSLPWLQTAVQGFFFFLPPFTSRMRLISRARSTSLAFPFTLELAGSRWGLEEYLPANHSQDKAIHFKKGGKKNKGRTRGSQPWQLFLMPWAAKWTHLFWASTCTSWVTSLHL